MKFIRTGMAFAIIGLAATAAVAQSTGGLTIHVSDDQGPLPGATVTLSSAERKVKTTSVVTDKNGQVFFPVLAAGGGYIVEVSFAEYSTVRLDNLRVKSSENEHIPVQLNQEYTEKIKVIGRREVVDLEKTSTSTKFSDEFISDLPVPGRFYQNVLTFAPGVQDANGDGNPNVHGSRARDVRALVGGVANVDPLTGQWRANVNPNSIEEMEVITAGAGPEFGRAQGAFVNIIQKQGGNDFEGVFDFIYRSSKLDRDGAANLPKEFTQEFDWIQPSIQISGPILKDKLWYRLSHEWIDREDPINTVNTLEVVEINQRINSDQITWQVSDRNKLAFKYDSNPLEVKNAGVSSLIPRESSQFRSTERDTYSVVWSAPYSPQIYVESVVALQDGGLSFGPTERDVPATCVVSQVPFILASQCTDIVEGTTSGSFFQDWDDQRQRFTVRGDATIYPRKRYLGMNHEFKTGFIVENERYERDLVRRPRMFFFVFNDPSDDAQSGGQFEPNPTGTALVQFSVPDKNHAQATGAAWGIFFRDQMKPRQNLTIEIGARLEREVINAEGRQPFDPQAEFQSYADQLAQGVDLITARTRTFTVFENVPAFRLQLAQILGVPQQTVNSFFGPSTQQANFQRVTRRADDISLSNDNLSPFIAATWDPWSNGKTKFAFTAGRHYNNIPLVIPTLERNPVTTVVRMNATQGIDETGVHWVIPEITQTRGVINPTASIVFVDRNLRTPYQDELTLTFERELWAETQISVGYINRKYRDQFQDIDVNQAPGDFGTCVAARRPGDPHIDTSTGPDGIIDDCGGEVIIPDPDEGSSGDPFGRSARFERPDGIPDLYRQNPFWGSIYLVGNFNKADYEAFVLALTRRQYRGWELQGSYTWAMAKGDGEDYDQFLGDDQTNRDDEFGFQSNDQRHVVKMLATTITPWGFRLGGSVTWQSGLPYSLLTNTLSWDSVPPITQELGEPEPRPRLTYKTGVRNDQRNRSYWDFDIKATKEWNLGRGLNLQLAAEMFNLFGDDTYTIYSPGAEIGFQVNGNNSAFRRFGRRYQLSTSLSF